MFPDEASFVIAFLGKWLYSVRKAAVKQVVIELAELNRKVETIIGIMQKPENRFFKIMEVVGNAVTIIGILAVVDIVKQWIIGG